MEYLLGIDGGGTRTTGWLTDDQDRILARVVAGPSNPLKVGFPSAQQQILRAFRQTRREAHLRSVMLAAVCVGLAGSDSPSVHNKLARWLRKSIPARAHLLTTDANIALSAAVGDSTGIVVIAGTGSVAYGRDEHGHYLRCGGWGNCFDDAGSGYDLGRKAVRSALRALDGRGEATGLADSLRRELGLSNITDVITCLQTPQKIAALFPLVVQEAVKGDAVARQLCNQAASDLAELALALITRFGWKRCVSRVVCAGGIFRCSPTIRRKFAQQIHAQAPHARITLLHREPVEGALNLARQLLHR